jgi:hypothetical protein
MGRRVLQQYREARELLIGPPCPKRAFRNRALALSLSLSLADSLDTFPIGSA